MQNVSLCSCIALATSFVTLSFLTLWIYENYICELRSKERMWKKIIAVIDATFAVAKRKFQASFSQLQKLRL